MIALGGSWRNYSLAFELEEETKNMLRKGPSQELDSDDAVAKDVGADLYLFGSPHSQRSCHVIGG